MSLDPNTSQITATDGESVPITIVYRKDLRRLGGNPALIVGYGAYGLSMHPTFALSVFSLLDRGFIHAIAHVRGGRERGDRWYAQGRLLNKRNTFADFVAVTESLIAQGYADPQAMFAQSDQGRSLICDPTFTPASWRRCRLRTLSPRCAIPRSRSRHLNTTNGVTQR